MRLSTIVLASVFAVLLTGCSIRVHQSDLYGEYIAKFQSGTERLVLNRDGTYVQQVSLARGGEPVVNTGSWIWDGSDKSVLLRDCLGVNDGHGDIRPDFAVNRGGCGLSVERKWIFFGQLSLGSDESGLLRKVK